MDLLCSDFAIRAAVALHVDVVATGGSTYGARGGVSVKVGVEGRVMGCGS